MLAALAAALVVAFALPSAASGAAADGTRFDVTLQRGTGTQLALVARNSGPSPTVVQGGTSGWSIALDCTCSGAQFMIVPATIQAPTGWTCGGAYDVLRCVKQGAFGVGESATFRFATTRCYPASHAYEISYFTSDAGSLNGHIQDGSFSGPSGDCLLKIAPLRVAYDEIVARAVAQLKAEGQSLGRQRDELEATLVKDGATADAALAAESQLQPAKADLARRLSEWDALAARLQGTKEATPPASAQAALQARTSLERSLAALEPQIVALRRAGSDASPLSARYRDLQQQLQRVDADVAQHLRASPVADLLDEAARKLHLFRWELFSLREQEAALEYRRTAAQAALQADLQRRGQIDDRLMQMAQTLAGLDFELREVQVQASGQPVLRATTRVALDKLDALNRRIEQIDKALPGLAEEKEAANQDFVQASQAALAAGNDLAALLYRQRWEKFAIDYVANLYDVGKAGAKGGLVGAVAETLKKVVEFAAFEYVLPKSPGETVDPTSIEAQVQREYGAGLKDSLGVQQIGYAGAQRFLKDTASKYGKDSLNKYLGSLVFAKVEYPAKLQQARAAVRAAGSATDFAKAIKRAAGLRKQLDNLGKGYRYELKNLAESVVKDAVKLGAKALLEREERAAWQTFFQRDIEARLRYPAYQVASHFYWQAVDERQALLDEKAKLLDGADPSGFDILLSNAFSAGSPLTVTLALGASGQQTVAQVTVADRPATGGPTVYTVDSVGLVDSQGGLALTIH